MPDNLPYETIKQCRSCLSPHLTEVLDLGLLHLVGFTKQPTPFVSKAPLTLMICDRCGLVQLRDTADRHRLYDEYWYMSGVNDTMKWELGKIVIEAEEFLKDGDLVIDIGCNDGTLLSLYNRQVTKIGFDPAENLLQFSQKHADHIFNEFFKYHSELPPAQVITAISMFYDLDDPNTFLDHVVKSLAPGGVFIIQQNYLGTMIANDAFDNIVHEHLEYYSLATLESLLNRHGLEVFKVEMTDLNGGSFRTFIQNIGKRPIDQSVVDMRAKEINLGLEDYGPRGTYGRFAWRVKQNKRRVFSFIQDRRFRGKRWHIYGASTRGNTLLQYYDLDTKAYIDAAAERNPIKWGTYMVGSEIPVISEEESRKLDPDFYLVLPWFFKDEFVARERESGYMRTLKGKLLFPLPNFKLVGKNSVIQ